MMRHGPVLVVVIAVVAAMLVMPTSPASPAGAQPSPDDQEALLRSARTASLPALPFDRPGLLPPERLRAGDRTVRPYCGSDAFIDSDEAEPGLDIVAFELDYDCENDLLVAAADVESRLTARQIRRYELWMDADLDLATGCGGADYLALLVWQRELFDFAGGLFALSSCDVDAELIAPSGYVKGDRAAPAMGLLVQGSDLSEETPDVPPGPPERMRWFQVLVSQTGASDRAPDAGWSEFVLPTGADRIVIGDWNADGVDTLGVVRGETFLLSNLNETGLPEVSYRFGISGGARFVGDWDGDGADTASYRVGNVFYMRNENSRGLADAEIGFGRPGDEVVTGDWDGDGIDTFGVRRRNTIYLDNDGLGGPADVEVAFGRADDELFVGDWDGDGIDTFAVRRGNRVLISNEIATFEAEEVLVVGEPGGRPGHGAPDQAVIQDVLVGDWDGDGIDTFGLRTGNEFRLSNDLELGDDDDRVFTFGR